MSAFGEPTPMQGSKRLWASLALALANLIVVLDMTIANVSIPHISGNLAITPSQGTWIVTSYAVADAITVPLTGWLAQRFGTVRSFIFCLLGFGVFSVLCGLSVTLDMLVAARIGQGICGGPLMPLTQVLLMRITPVEKRGQSMGLWAMTTLLGPALGPIIGGTISDNWSWHWIFFINVPIIFISFVGVMALVRPYETTVTKVPIDIIGLVLLVTWIGSLQIMLDIGREHDWFADTTVVLLGLVALVGFIAFVIWELTEEHPIVDLRIFRYRGFTISALALALGFGAYFSGIVVIPQWMQLSLGYTATMAGLATAFAAMASILMAQIPPRLMARGIDPRLILSAGLVWMGCATLLRTDWTSGADFMTLAFPQMVMGLGMPFFFLTVTQMSLSYVKPSEMASAAGMQSFLRTVGIAITTSIAMTFWTNESSAAGSDLAGSLNPGQTIDTLTASGFSMEQSRSIIARLVDQEAITLATDRIFFISGTLMIAVAAFVWLAPRVKRNGVPGAGGH